jgi:hypothetical protein
MQEAWTRGTKVADADGKPLVVFHGSMDARSEVTLPQMTHFGTVEAARDRLLQFSGRLPRGWDDAYSNAVEDMIAKGLNELSFVDAKGETCRHLYPDGSRMIPARLRILKPSRIRDDGQPHTTQVVAEQLLGSWKFFEELEES